MMASFATARTDSYASSSKDFLAATARLKKTRMKRKWVLALFFIFFPPSFLELCALLLPIYRGEHWDAGGGRTTRIYYFISSWGKRYDGRWERCVTWSFIIKKRADMVHGVNGKPRVTLAASSSSPSSSSPNSNLIIEEPKGRPARCPGNEGLFFNRARAQFVRFWSPLVPRRQHVAPVR